MANPLATSVPTISKASWIVNTCEFLHKRILHWAPLFELCDCCYVIVTACSHKMRLFSGAKGRESNPIRSHWTVLLNSKSEGLGQHTENFQSGFRSCKDVVFVSRGGAHGTSHKPLLKLIASAISWLSFFELSLFRDAPLLRFRSGRGDVRSFVNLHKNCLDLIACWCANSDLN